MKTILVPTDFSAPAQNAVNYAIELVKKFNSQLILLNVYSLPLPTYDSIPAIDRASQIQESSIAGLSELKQIVLNAGVDSEIICLSKNGSAIVQIEETVAEYKVEAIVMGITGDAGKLKEKIIGSTALDVARGVDIPLFIIPETVAYKNINKLSFACDIDNLYGSRILENLKSICNLFKAKLEIVNIEKEAVEEDPRKIRNQNFIESNLLDLKHEMVILTEDDSHGALQKYFTNHIPDLVVLYPRKQNFIQSLFHKSMTKSMAFHSNAPLMIIH